jgi:hypothetical protein
MIKSSNFLYLAAFFWAFLYCTPGISAADPSNADSINKNILNKDKHKSSRHLKKQGYSGFADLPALDQDKISQRMENIEYRMSRCEEILPSGRTSRYRAFNRNNNMSAYFTDQGVHVLYEGRKEPDRYLEMIFSGYGYKGHKGTVQSTPPELIRVSDQRIEYRRGVITEWYENSKQGLEHGVILSEPPSGKKKERIVLEWTISGSVNPRLETGDTAVAFGKSKDETILRYSDLKVWDATGRTLPAKLAVQSTGSRDLPSRISFVIDDHEAIYPVMIDPLFTEVKKITASDGAAGDEFGYSISISGDTVAVGSDDARNSNTGAVYIFERNKGGANQWGLVKKIIAKDGESNDFFGNSDSGSAVSISGDTIAVGSYYDETNGLYYSGSVYIFRRDQGGIDNWGLVKKIYALDIAADNWFGDSVSLSGDTLVIGADGADGISPGDQFGAVYIYRRDKGGTDNWGFVKKIAVSDGAAYDYFGYHVAISGDTVVVGSDDTSRNDAGAAYIFYRDKYGTEQWGLVKKITAGDGAANDFFGESVSISGDTVVIGSDDAGRDNAGAAYIYSRNTGGTDKWGLVKKLTAGDGAADDYFGYHLAISGDTVAVGSDDVNRDNAGAVYIFKRDEGGAGQWGQVQKITASDGAASDYFSYSVAIDGRTVAAAASYDDDNGVSSGSAYVFKVESKAMPWIPLLLQDD